MFGVERLHTYKCPELDRTPPAAFVPVAEVTTVAVEAPWTMYLLPKASVVQ